MSLFDLYQDGTDGAVQAMIDAPIAPPKPPERGLWRTAADSLRGAGAKAMASVLEVGGAIGPGLVADLDTAALDKAKAPLDFGQSEQSRPFRDFERSLRPDPATAGKAEQIVYGLVGPAVGIVGAAVAGGVPGLVAAAGEMGFSESEELRQKGVDLGTRSAVGALTAGVTAVGGVLPLAGPTLKATAGLYLAGGPGAFMAQQAATSSILSRAGYGDIAQQYDPLDPAGLAVSALIPLPFAAAGAARNVRAARAPKAGEAVAEPMPEAPAAPIEAVDAAMVHNLTLQRDVSAAGAAPNSPIPRDVGLAPVDRAIETRLADKITSDFDAAAAEYAARKDSMGGKVLNTDIARELSPDYLADRTRSAAVHEPASWFVKQLYAKKLAEMQPGERVMFSSGGTGAGKTTAIDQLGLADDAAIVYDTNMNSLPSAVQKVEQALAADATVRIVHVQRDPVEALTAGALPRAMRQAKEFGTGRTVPMSEHAKTHRGAAEVLLQLAERYKDDPRVQITVLDNTRGKGGVRVTDLGFIRGFDYTGLEGKLHEALIAERDAGRISGDVFRATEGAGIDGPGPLQPPVRRGGGGEPQPQRDGPGPAGSGSAEAVGVDPIRAAVEDAVQRLAGRTHTELLDELRAAGDLPPLLNNALIAAAEFAADPRRLRALLADAAGRKGNPADALADAVERVRTLTDEQLTQTENPPKAAADPLLESVSNRVAVVEATTPELPVGLDADGRTVTAAEAMAQARREAQEGTDVELGSNDAPLLQAAIDCALS